MTLYDPPDWRDPRAYPSDLSSLGWVWEFLRRSPDYHRAFARFHDPAQTWEETFFPFGPNGVLHPATTPLDERVHRLRPPGKVRILSETETPGVWVDAVSTFLPESFSPPIGETCALVFDLGRPLAEQIEQARSLLEQGQSRVKADRQRANKYRTYLRLVDAEVEGATQTEMARVIFGKEIEDKDDSVRANVRDGLKAAHLLMDKVYLRIATGRNKTLSLFLP